MVKFIDKALEKRLDKLNRKALEADVSKRGRYRKIPYIIVTILLVYTLYFSAFGLVKVASLVISHYYGREAYLLPYLFFKFEGVHLLAIPLVAIPAIYGWLLSTRVQKYQTPRMRVFTFFNMIVANGSMLTAYGMTKLQDNVLPFFYDRLDRVIQTDDVMEQALFSNKQSFFFLVELLPIILMLFIGMFVVTKYRKHDLDIQRAFFTFKWTGEWLRKFENLENVTDAVVPYPDVELGLNAKTNEMVVSPGFDRTLNTAIIGSIGTGKTAALGLPIINQDLHHFTHFINKSPALRDREDYISEDIQGRFLNGISIIEPSNDLCKKVYQLAKAHGIDDKAITYIDPTNPNTPNLNFLKGPVEKVSEVFAQVLAGLADNGGGGNFYFEQAQRSHLKQHIYLLKLHTDEEVTFDDLMQMYEDANVVHKMHKQFKERILKKFPMREKEIGLRKNRDRYNEWLLYSGIDKWFNNVIVQQVDFKGEAVTDIHGEPLYYDLFEKDVKGLRNILTDIGRNPLLARVLNGKSEFDFDKHMGSEGGILLVNTAKGQLEALGATFGKMVLMTLQNATFRREPNVSPFHHILADEAPEYYYSAFASFPAQSRKFKVIVTTLQQTLTQLRGAFGEDYMNSVIAAMRNRMVYADVSNFDGQYFSEMFGEKEVYREGENEQAVSPLQDDPVSRSGSSYQKVKEAALSSGEILFQDAFECAVKIVVNNKTMPVQQIKANFVPKEEFTEAVVKVDADMMAQWIENRYKVDDTPAPFTTIGDAEEIDADLQEANDALVEKQRELMAEEIGRERALSAHVPPQPVGHHAVSAEPAKAAVSEQNKGVPPQAEQKAAQEAATSAATAPAEAQAAQGAGNGEVDNVAELLENSKVPPQPPQSPPQQQVEPASLEQKPLKTTVMEGASVPGVATPRRGGSRVQQVQAPIEPNESQSAASVEKGEDTVKTEVSPPQPPQPQQQVAPSQTEGNSGIDGELLGKAKMGNKKTLSRIRLATDVEQPTEGKATTNTSAQTTFQEVTASQLDSASQKFEDEVKNVVKPR